MNKEDLLHNSLVEIIIEEIKNTGSFIKYTIYGVLAVTGGVPFIIDIILALNFSLTMKLLASLVLLFGYILLIILYFLYRIISKSNDIFRKRNEEFFSLATLYSIAAIVLANDNGDAWIPRNIEFDKIYREVDQTSEYYKFSSIYKGKVIEGSIDHIPIKFDSDFELDTDEINASVRGKIVRRNGGEHSFECSPRILADLSGPYDVILELPFGEDNMSLKRKDEFELRFEGDPMGETSDEKDPEVHIHFPLYRFTKIKQFTAEIKLPTDFNDAQAAKIKDIDYDKYRNGVFLNQLDFLEITDEPNFKKISEGEFRIDDDNANNLYVARLKRD